MRSACANANGVLGCQLFWLLLPLLAFLPWPLPPLALPPWPFHCLRRKTTEACRSRERERKSLRIGGLVARTFPPFIALLVVFLARTCRSRRRRLNEFIECDCKEQVARKQACLPTRDVATPRGQWLMPPCSRRSLGRYSPRNRTTVAVSLRRTAPRWSAGLS